MTQKAFMANMLADNKLVKMIAGIDNTDLNRVEAIVKAAELAGAGAVDVAATPEVVALAKSLTSLPVFASSVDANALAQAVAAGADVAEIGNFDALYAQGFYMTAQDVLNLTQETLALLPEGTPVSVTIPGHLSLGAQMALAQELEALGVALIQTEGASSVVTLTREVQILSAQDKVRRTMENTYAISQTVRTPVMTASGIDADNVAEAFANGAVAVGVGSSVNKLASQEDMVAQLKAILNAVSAVKSNVAKVS